MQTLKGDLLLLILVGGLTLYGGYRIASDGSAAQIQELRQEISALSSQAARLQGEKEALSNELQRARQDNAARAERVMEVLREQNTHPYAEVPPTIVVETPTPIPSPTPSQSPAVIRFRNEILAVRRIVDRARDEALQYEYSCTGVTPIADRDGKWISVPTS